MKQLDRIVEITSQFKLSKESAKAVSETILTTSATLLAFYWKSYVASGKQTQIFIERLNNIYIPVNKKLSTKFL